MVIVTIMILTPTLLFLGMRYVQRKQEAKWLSERPKPTLTRVK